MVCTVLCIKNPEGEHIFHFQSKKGLLGFPSLDATERASQAFPGLSVEWENTELLLLLMVER